MKKDTIIFILALLVLIISLALYNFTPLRVAEDTSSTNDTEVVTDSVNKGCYLRHLDTPLGGDDMYLEVSVTAQGIVSGKFNILPAAKDKLTGPFIGNWREASETIILDVTHTYTAEGVVAQEKRVFRLTPNGADISFDQGETYVETLPLVACESVDERIVNGK